MLVIADFGGARILAATPAKALNKEFTEFKLTGFTLGLAGAPNGQIAFSEPGAMPEAFGLIAPPNPPQFTEAPAMDPTGVAFGSDGAFWIAEAFGTPGAGTLTRLTTDNKATVLSGFANNERPRQIAAGPGNTLWVTLPALGEEPDLVARVSGVEPPGSNGGAPETRIAKGPKGKVKTKGKKAKVSFRFSSPDAGASFECRIARKRKGAKAPAFAACKSPQAYRLKPGHYRFEVRAVLKGVADDSPASRSFKVVHVPRHRHR
jgi:hypothetical protein